MPNITCFCFLKCLFYFEISSDAINTFPRLSVPAVPGAVAVTPPAMSGHMTVPGVTGIPVNSVLLVSNLNSEVCLIGGSDASINLYQVARILLAN